MFTTFMCPSCQKALVDAGQTSYACEPRNGYVARVHISTTVPATVVRCENGHDAILVIHDGGFSLLYQRGLQRLATGSPRDAVIDAHTALEMFLAHVPVRAVYDRTPDASPAEIRKQLSKAQVLKNSERIFGAAIVCAAASSGQRAVVMDLGKTRNIRNDAVHNGVEPTEAEAETVCFEVERTIRELMSQLDVQKCVNAMPYFEADFVERLADFRKVLPPMTVGGVVNASFGTAFCLNMKSERRAKDYLADYRDAHAEGDEAWPVW